MYLAFFIGVASIEEGAPKCFLLILPGPLGRIYPVEIEFRRVVSLRDDRYWTYRKSRLEPTRVIE